QRDKETKRQRGKEAKKQRNKETKIQGAISVRPTRKPRLSIRWREVPGTAAVHMVVAVAAFDPGRTIRRRVIIIVVDAILDPLIDVADHVIEAERIGLE